MVISFFARVLSLARTTTRGFRNDPEFRAIVVLLAVLLGGGTL